MTRGLAAAAAMALAACAGLRAPEPVVVSDGRYVMGTVLEATLVAADEASGRAALAELFALAEALDARLTTWDPESDLSRLNRAAGQGPRPVSPDLARLLALSTDYARRTGGSFDVTIGPLVTLWTEAARRGAPPSEAELAAARERVGARFVRVHADGTAELTRAGVEVNLGGVAKGYALDRMKPLLAARGIGRALLSFGQSSTLALGRPPGASAWRLLARGPGADLLGLLSLEDRALSVSGSLGQWALIDGRRYGHVFDPRSGRALTRRRQALVVAPEAGLAEALSKALLVLGASEGLALVAAQPGCEGLLVDADGSAWRTPGWDGAVRFEPLPAGPDDQRGSPRLKDAPRRSDVSGMKDELNCPICSADVPLAGDEKVGDEVYCTFCGAPLRLTKRPQSDEEDYELEEDM